MGIRITPEIVSTLLTTVDAGLSSGLGSPTPGNMCVEAAVCYALGLPHGDDPGCVDPILRDLKISLNDSKWSTKKARADGLRKLAVLQLGSKNLLDQNVFADKLAMMTINTVLPFALNAIGLAVCAERCIAAKTLKEGITASDASYARAASDASDASYARAASYASYARAARYASYASYASYARAASYAARYAANAARYASYASYARAARYAANAARAASYASDKILKTFAVGVENILIEMQVPAIKFLPMLD